MSADMNMPLIQETDTLMNTMFQNSGQRCLGPVNSTDGKGLVCFCCQRVIRDGEKDYNVMDKPVCETCINDVDVAWRVVDALWKKLKEIAEDVNAVLRGSI